jgi:hypothetical protein
MDRKLASALIGLVTAGCRVRLGPVPSSSAVRPYPPAAEGRYCSSLSSTSEPSPRPSSTVFVDDDTERIGHVRPVRRGRASGSPRAVAFMAPHRHAQVWPLRSRERSSRASRSTPSRVTSSSRTGRSRGSRRPRPTRPISCCPRSSTPTPTSATRSRRRPVADSRWTNWSRRRTGSSTACSGRPAARRRSPRWSQPPIHAELGHCGVHGVPRGRHRGRRGDP